MNVCLVLLQECSLPSHERRLKKKTVGLELLTWASRGFLKTFLKFNVNCKSVCANKT